MSRIFLLIYAAAAALFTSNCGALAQLGLQNALLSSLDRDVTPPPFPTVNVHLDEAPPSDEKETDLARVIRDDNAAQRRMRDAFVARRRAFQALMSDVDFPAAGICPFFARPRRGIEEFDLRHLLFANIGLPVVTPPPQEIISGFGGIGQRFADSQQTAHS